MPTYTYRCETCGQSTDRVFRISDRPDAIACGCGGGDATRVFSPPDVPHRPNHFGTGQEHRGVAADSAATWVWYRCDEGHESLVKAVTPPDTVECEEDGCDLVAERDRTPPRFGNRYWVELERDGGRFDVGLGQHVYSKAHRDALCQQLGVAPVDGDMRLTEEEAQRRLDDEERADIREYADYYSRFHNDPGFAEARALVDQGRCSPLAPPTPEP